MARRKRTKRSAAARAAIVAAAESAGAAVEQLGRKPRGRPRKVVTELEEDFGGAALDRELADDADAADAADAANLPPPPPPAPPMRPGEVPSVPPASILALGPPPEDALAAQAWLHRAMVLTAADAMTDPDISAATRRRELRTIAIAADKLVPNRDLWEAREIIKGDRAELEQRARARSGAKLEASPASIADGAKVIPIRAMNDGQLPHD